MKYKAVLFDLDGTLLDTAKDIMGACNHTLEKYGYKALSEDLLRTKVTAGMREMLKLGVPQDKWDEAGLLSVQHIPKVLVARCNKRKSFACKELRQAPAVVL